MKTIATLIIILSFTLSILGQERNLLDSITYSDNGLVETKIYKNPSILFSLLHDSEVSKEIRFYDENGFFCLAVYLDKENSFLKLENGELLKKFVHDHYKDPVFLSDTFAHGFINKLKSFNNVPIREQFEKTINYYYLKRDYIKVHHISDFLEQNEKPEYFRPKPIIEIIDNDTVEIQEEILFFYKIYGCGASSINERLYNDLKGKLLSDIKIPKIYLDKKNYQLIIEFEANWKGELQNIKLITKLNHKIEKRIIENFEKVKDYKLLPSNPRCRPIDIKAALFFDLE